MTTIPTINQLYQGILNDLQTEMDSTIPLFGRIFLRALAAVQAAKLKLIYITIGLLQKNIFIDTADPEAKGGTLERFGRVKLGRNPFPAQAGQYAVNVTGTAAAVIPASTTFKSNDDSLNPGKLYVLDTPFTFVSGSGSILLRSLNTGAGAKLEVGDQLTATAPIPNVTALAVVSGEVVEPLDSEAIEEYRRKGIEAYQLEPHGGAPSDFRIWAADVQGVARVYPYARTGASGEVDLYVEANPADSTDGFGTPSSTMLEEVEEVVELDPDITKPILERGRRPLGIFQVHYLPVTIREIDIVINDFQGITAPIQTSIFNAIKAELDTVRPFVAGADVLENKNDIFDLNKIISIILTVRPGSTFGEVDLFVDGVEENTHTFTAGDIPRLDTITYP